MLYFGYGSNLNQKDFEEWAERTGSSVKALLFKQIAKLPDYRPAYTYFSRTRNGGVLDVVKDPGAITLGGLFEADKNTEKALNAKEGCGSCYDRIQVKVITENGIEEAFTYVVVEKKKEKYVKPSETYVEVVRQGLLDHHFPQSWIERMDRAAKNIEETAQDYDFN